MNKDERDIRDRVDSSMESTVFFVGAPPRSGNTYLRYVLQDAYNNPHKDTDELFAYNHSSAFALKHLLESENDLPIFISPIRDPYDTLKSKLVRTFEEWGANPGIVEYATAVDDLCLYWEILLVNPSKFCLVDFNELIADKDRIVEKLDDRYPSVVIYRNASPLTNEQILDNVRLEDSQQYRNNEKLFLSSGHVPRAKSEYSELADELLSSPVYSRRFAYLYEMYKELLELTI